MTELVQVTPFNQKVTILNDNKLRLTGEPLEGNEPNRLPWMCFALVQNYPYIKVNLNNGKQKEEAKFDLALDQVAFQAIISAMEDAVRSKEPTMITIGVKLKGFDRATNRPTDPYLYATVTVGKDADGCEFIGIQRGKKDSKNYVSLKFGFTDPEFHPVIETTTGQPASRQRVSNLIARGFIRLLNHYMTVLNVMTWRYENTGEGKFALKQAEQRGGGQGGNGGNSGYKPQYNQNNSSSNQSSGYSSEQESSNPVTKGFDENLPW